MSSTTSETSRQKAYIFIQRKLLEGEIRAGDLVSELALAAEIGMSRTPIREAIGQLELEGLFDKVPRVGTLVRLPDHRELRELYEVREALESHAASLAASLVNANALAEIEHWHREVQAIIAEIQKRGLEFLDGPLLHRFFDADIGFHCVIIGATDNQRTLKIINEFRVVQRVFEYGQMTYNLNFIESVVREHGEVLDALKRGVKEDAREAMANHIRSSLEHALQRQSLHSANEIALHPAPQDSTAAETVTKSRRKFNRPLAAVSDAV